jgi:ABC-type sugar transport system permease subunit
MPMTVLELSRWQFGITTVYHFIFVPLTIGLSILVACMQTAWLVKKDPVYLRMTKFFGTLFLINFAVGVVTGIVEEFQFGMNWSATLLITHELDGLDQVDEIVVFDHGRVAERGTHAQLIPSGGAYHRLWQAGHPGRPA